jgi:hypothetical protein
VRRVRDGRRQEVVDRRDLIAVHQHVVGVAIVHDGERAPVGVAGQVGLHVPVGVGLEDDEPDEGVR